jgi:hypothetical protein
MISERAFAKSFNSFWSELLPLLTPRFMAQFNAGYEVNLMDSLGQKFTSLPVGEGVERPDIVAEFAFRLAKTICIHQVDPHEMQSDAAVLDASEKEAFELISRYEGIKPDEVHPLSALERKEGLLLCSRYQSLYEGIPNSPIIEYCPTFPGAGFLNSSEGDIAVGNSLIEVKTTTRKPSGKDVRQLIIYAALDANNERDHWSHFGIFNPRRGTLHYVEIDSLLLRLSGGKTKSDVFSEIISYVESFRQSVDHQF